MRVDIDINNFTSGELSPRMKGRYDQAKYFNGCDTLTNWVIIPQGGATRRPGTMFVTQALDQSNPCKLRRFTFSTVQSYMLEFSAQGAGCQVRVFMDDGVVLEGATQVIIPGLPYAGSEL